MVLWQGLTEGGTAVPVQVTEEGKVVAQGQQGEKGDKGDTGDQGPAGPPGEYGPGDDVQFGSAFFEGNVGIGTTTAASKLDVFASTLDTTYIRPDQSVAKFGAVGNNGIYLGFLDDGGKGYPNYIQSGYLDAAGSIQYPLALNPKGGNVGIRTDFASETLHVTGTGLFTSDVVVGSRGKQWMLVESGGLCHMVDQSTYLTSSTFTHKSGAETTVTHLEQPVDYPVLRDIQAELTMVEQQLQKVMERLNMVPEAGWQVWDGSN